MWAEFEQDDGVCHRLFFAAAARGQDCRAAQFSLYGCHRVFGRTTWPTTGTAGSALTTSFQNFDLPSVRMLRVFKPSK
jgi:hypothetical protein